MSRFRFDYSHADQGTKPSTALNFEANERPEAQNFDWYWYHVIEAINGHSDEFDRLDDDGDGVVDRADYADDADASSYKGTDIDPDGDGKVDNEHVEGLTNLGGGEAFSAYPIQATDIANGAVTPSELDLSMSPSWTGEHEFAADVDLDGGSGGAVAPVGTDRWATK